MSEDHPPEPHQPGLAHAGLRLGGTVVRSLAPQFLTLLLLNLLLVGGLGYYVDARARHTAALLDRLLTVCVERVSH